MKKTISLLFAGILAALLLAVCLLPQRTFSDMENRSLQQFPAPTLNGVRSREWMDQMESWLADQFPGRTFFVRTKASLDYLLGKRDLHDTYIGSDGRFFEVFDAQPDEAQLNKNIGYLQDFLTGTQRTAYFLPVYSAFTIYPEQLPAGAQGRAGSDRASGRGHEHPADLYPFQPVRFEADERPGAESMGKVGGAAVCAGALYRPCDSSRLSARGLSGIDSQSCA